MKWMQIMPMVLTGVAAVLCDLDKGKIPNGLILLALAAGFGWQVSMYGAAGLLHFLGGMMLPVLLLGGLFYFRMMGAGDIKHSGSRGIFRYRKSNSVYSLELSGRSRVCLRTSFPSAKSERETAVFWHLCAEIFQNQKMGTVLCAIYRGYWG